MPPEISGLDIKERLGSSVESMRDYVQTMNEMAMANQAGYSSLALMLETMHKSHYSFTEFMQILEKTNVVLYTTVRMINELGQNIKGATGSVEGLISAFGMMGGKVMPELAHHIAMSSKSTYLHIDAMQEEAKMLKESMAQKTNTINLAVKEIERYKEKGVLTDKESAAMNTAHQVLGRVTKEREHEGEHLEDLTDKLNDASGTMDKFGKMVTTMLGPVTLVITAGIALAQAYDNSIKAKREVIYTLGRMGVSYSQNVEAMDKFNIEFTTIANRWGMLREEMAKAVAPLAALGIGGKGTITTIEDIAGGMFRGFGIDMGSTIKSLGTFSTALDLKGKALGDTFLEIAGHGQKSVLGMQRYITEVTSMIEQTRRFGGTQGSAMIMLDAFGEEVRKGTISMQDLARLASPSMWSTSQQASVATMMQKFAPGQAAGLGIAGVDTITAMVRLQTSAQEQPKLFVEGLGKIFDKLMPGGGTREQQQFFTQQFLQQMTGVTIPMAKVTEAFSDPAKLVKLMTGGAKPLTLEGMKETFKLTETVGERTAVAVEAMRGTVEGIGMLLGVNTQAAAKAELTDYSEKRMREELQKAGYDTGSVTGMNLIESYNEVVGKRKGRGSANISIGDVHIGVTGGGDVKVQVREQLDKFTDHVLNKVEEHWTMLQNSQ